MNCLIVDDNVMELAIIKKLVSMTSELHMVAECTDTLSAYEQMQIQDVDLLFLDIEMPVMNGVDLVKSLGGKRPLIIFTSSAVDYAAEVFELNVADGVYSIHSSLKSVEEKLSKSTFIRVHRSFIIDVSKIDTIEGGTLIVNHNIVPVSDAYRSGLYKRMQIL